MSEECTVFITFRVHKCTMLRKIKTISVSEINQSATRGHLNRIKGSGIAGSDAGEVAISGMRCSMHYIARARCVVTEYHILRYVGRSSVR